MLLRLASIGNDIVWIQRYLFLIHGGFADFIRTTQQKSILWSNVTVSILTVSTTDIYDRFLKKLSGLEMRRNILIIITLINKMKIVDFNGDRLN